MARTGIVFRPLEQPSRPPRSDAELTLERKIARVSVAIGTCIRDERRRKRLSMRDLAAVAGVALGTVHAAEHGRSCELETYVRIARALGLRPEFALVDPRRREQPRRRDLVHAAMGETEAAHFRRLGCEVRLDEPYHHHQFAGRADLAAFRPAERALLHIENKTELDDLQEAFGSFNAKRAYLGRELADRAGIERWRSETHVLAVLWSSDNLRTLRRHRASFDAVCPDVPDAFDQWWSGRLPEPGRRSILVFFDPVAGRPVGDPAPTRPRYRDYAAAADAINRKL